MLAGTVYCASNVAPLLAVGVLGDVVPVPVVPPDEPPPDEPPPQAARTKEAAAAAANVFKTALLINPPSGAVHR
ncbi:hypothetical protein [Burkholderia vietnamiensis]|uniref:hypothetical protein n=1 Tax=Burkholderia vietnamiensis TaxID=60552 RepID=UPI001588549E|nr:hypothetical protein [Burkholderia vietnamiensis]